MYACDSGCSPSPETIGLLISLLFVCNLHLFLTLCCTFFPYFKLRMIWFSESHYQASEEHYLGAAERELRNESHPSMCLQHKVADRNKVWCLHTPLWSERKALWMPLSQNTCHTGYFYRECPKLQDLQVMYTGMDRWCLFESNTQHCILNLCLYFSPMKCVNKGAAH